MISATGKYCFSYSDMYISFPAPHWACPLSQGGCLFARFALSYQGMGFTQCIRRSILIDISWAFSNSSRCHQLRCDQHAAGAASSPTHQGQLASRRHPRNQRPILLFRPPIGPAPRAREGRLFICMCPELSGGGFITVYT
jgi:hypothetical protein